MSELTALPAVQAEPRRPGRPKGSKSKHKTDVAARLRKLGFDPIDTLVGIANEPDNPIEFRLRAASELLPYIAPKLRSVEVAIKQEEPFTFQFIALRGADA